MFPSYKSRSDAISTIIIPCELCYIEGKLLNKEKITSLCSKSIHRFSRKAAAESQVDLMISMMFFDIIWFISESLLYTLI